MAALVLTRTSHMHTSARLDGMARSIMMKPTTFGAVTRRSQKQLDLKLQTHRGLTPGCQNPLCVLRELGRFGRPTSPHSDSTQKWDPSRLMIPGMYYK